MSNHRIPIYRRMFQNVCQWWNYLKEKQKERKNVVSSSLAFILNLWWYFIWVSVSVCVSSHKSALWFIMPLRVSICWRYGLIFQSSSPSNEWFVTFYINFDLSVDSKSFRFISFARSYSWARISAFRWNVTTPHTRRPFQFNYSQIRRYTYFYTLHRVFMIQHLFFGVRMLGVWHFYSFLIRLKSLIGFTV